MLVAQDDTGSWWQEPRSGLLRHIWGGFVVSHIETLPGQRRRKCVSVDRHSPREKTAFILSILTHVWKIPVNRGKNKMLWGYRGVVYWFIEEKWRRCLCELQGWSGSVDRVTDWVQVSLAGLLSLCPKRGEYGQEATNDWVLERETRRKLTWAMSSGSRPLSWFSNAPHLFLCCLGIEAQHWFWIHCYCGWVGWFFWVQQSPVLKTLSLWDTLSLGSVAFVLGQLAGPFLSYHPCSQEVAVWLDSCPFPRVMICVGAGI